MTRIGRCIDPALTPYIEDAQQFNSQLGDLLRPALDTPEAAQQNTGRIDELADQQLPRALASTPPTEERVLPGRTPVRITPPGQFTAVYLHLHGGAWIIGPARAADLPNARIAATCGVAVVSVDYRLAPEHPHPAALDDSVDAAQWLSSNRPSRVRHHAPADRRQIIGSHPRGDDAAQQVIRSHRDLKHLGLAEGPPKRRTFGLPQGFSPDGPDQDTCFNFRSILTTAAQNTKSESHRCL